KLGPVNAKARSQVARICRWREAHGRTCPGRRFAAVLEVSMQPPVPVPRPLETERSPWIRGRLGVPGDAAMTALALVTAALAHGESRIEGGFTGPETATLAAALRELGVRVET